MLRKKKCVSHYPIRSESIEMLLVFSSNTVMTVKFEIRNAFIFVDSLYVALASWLRASFIYSFASYVV